jgi:hypothetical protein
MSAPVLFVAALFLLFASGATRAENPKGSKVYRLNILAETLA